MKPGEEVAVCDLIIRVFNEFVAPEYSLEGVQEFLRYVEPDLLSKRSKVNHFVIVAVAQDRVVGVVEVRDNDHISLFFVDNQFHQIGIGKALMGKALEICRKDKPYVSHVSVNSSLYAVPIYEKLGFHQSEPRQIRDGMVILPMVLELRDILDP